MDREIVEAKKRELQDELAKGQRLLAQHQQTMLRIQGALAVLDELLAEMGTPGSEEG